MSIPSGLISSNQIQQKTSSGSNENVSSEAFLQLLVLQMQNQDPLNPTQNEEMLSQLAQFSNLEQMTKLNENFEKSNQQSTFVQATSLLGKKVQVMQQGSTADNPTYLESSVTSVSYTNNGPQLTLANNLLVGLDDVVSVKE